MAESTAHVTWVLQGRYSPGHGWNTLETYLAASDAHRALREARGRHPLSHDDFRLTQVITVVLPD